jgi:hypothetical protein
LKINKTYSELEMGKRNEGIETKINYEQFLKSRNDRSLKIRAQQKQALQDKKSTLKKDLKQSRADM